MIRRHLQGMPTRPAVVLAVIVVIGSVGGYYYQRYNDCRYHATLREHLYAQISAHSGPTIALKALIPFAWQRLIIYTGYQSTGKFPECPFGWDWSGQYRQSLLDRSELNVLVFSREGRYPDYIDFSKSQINFPGIRQTYTPETAVFSITRQAGRKVGILLKPVH